MNRQIIVSCTRCTIEKSRAVRAEIDRDRALQLVSDTQTRLDAERRHSADLEARLLRNAPTWEPA